MKKFKSFLMVMYLFRYQLLAVIIGLSMSFGMLLFSAWIGRPDSVWIACDLMGLNVCN